MTGSPQERTFGRGRFRTGHGAGFRRIAEKIEGICLQRRRSCREARADLDRERDRVDRKHGPEHAAIGRVPTMRGRANRNDRSNPRPWVASAEYQAYVDAADAAAQSLYTAIMSGAVERASSQSCQLLQSAIPRCEHPWNVDLRIVNIKTCGSKSPAACW